MSKPGIPKNAKKVFQGVIFDVYQWPQKMYDGSFKTFEKIRRQDTVVIIPIVNGKIVVLKQQQPGYEWTYDLPSGRMDKKGESPKQAALRELREETGLVPKRIRKWRTYSPNNKIVQHVHFFIAEGCQQVGKKQLDNGEKITVMEKTFDEFLQMTDHPRCFFGPLMIDTLLARIHKRKYLELKSAILGKSG